MADYDKHAPGTFSWPELSTTDQKAGVDFYRALFGWDLNDMPMGPGETYSMFQMRGREVPAAATMRPQGGKGPCVKAKSASVVTASASNRSREAPSAWCRSVRAYRAFSMGW